MFYISLTVITKQKPMVDTQKRREKISKHTPTEKLSNYKENNRKKQKTYKAVTKQSTKLQ